MGGIQMDNQENRGGNVAAIVTMFALFFMIAFVTNFAGSMGVIVKNQFGASNAASQLGSCANFFAYLFMGIPGGLILKRKGYKFTLILACAVGFVGVGVQLLSGYCGVLEIGHGVYTIGFGNVGSFGIYVTGAFIAGFSMCLLNIVVNPMLNTLGGGGNRGNKLIQYGGTCSSIGGTIAPYFVGFLIGQSIKDATVQKAAPVMITAMAIFIFAFIAISLARIPEPHMETAEEKAARKSGLAQKDPHGPLSFRHFVLGAIAIFFYTGIEISIPNTANVYFSGLSDVGPAVTGIFIGAFNLCMLIGRLSGASFGSKISSRSMLTFTSIVAILLIVGAIFMPDTESVTFGKIVAPLSLVLLALCGLCTSVMWGTIFNLSAEGLGKYTATASGIFMTLVCGGGIIPFVQNAVADKIGSLNSYWILVFCLSYLVFYALIGSKNVNTDIPTD